VHHEMAVYVLASKALKGEYGNPPDFEKLESEIPVLANSFDSATQDEQEKFYATAWITMTTMLREEGYGPYGIPI